MAETSLSDQLQALLTTAREANRATSTRIPLEDFLAGLQHEATETREKSSLQTQVRQNCLSFYHVMLLTK